MTATPSELVDTTTIPIEKPNEKRRAQMETIKKELQLENGKTIILNNSAEKIFLRRRKHWFVLISPMLWITGAYLAILAVSVVASMFVQRLQILALPFMLLMTILYLNIGAKLIMDWLFNFYVLTDKRVLEIRYSPLFKDVINNVILSQVKTTEVSFESKGLINRLFNLGDVIITFDRPTHQDEFILTNVADPKDVCFLMAQVLDITAQSRNKDMMESPVWFRSHDGKGTYHTTDEILPAGNFRFA